MWGDPRISVTEFNILLYEALSKEDFRQKATDGLQKKHAGNVNRFIEAMMGGELYLVRQYGTILSPSKLESLIHYSRRRN